MIHCERGAPCPCSLECKIKLTHGQLHQEPILQTRAIEVSSLRSHRDNRFFELERLVSYKEKEREKERIAVYDNLIVLRFDDCT
jgi:hypothetical protein